MELRARLSVRKSETIAYSGAGATVPRFSKDFVIHVDASEAGAENSSANIKVTTSLSLHTLVAVPTTAGATTLRRSRMLCGCTRNLTLGTLLLGATFRLRNRSCGAKMPLLNAGYIEHVNTLSYRITSLTT